MPLMNVLKLCLSLSMCLQQEGRKRVHSEHYGVGAPLFFLATHFPSANSLTHVTPEPLPPTVTLPWILDKVSDKELIPKIDF